MAFTVSKVGQLGTSDVTSVGVKNVYTVPSGSTANVKVMWSVTWGGATDFDVYTGSRNIYANRQSGTEFTITGAPVSSGAGILETRAISPSSVGVWEGDVSAGVGSGFLAAPLPIEYALASEESVSYEISNSPAAELMFSVQGREFTT